MKKYDAVISGYICIDLIPDFKKSEPSANISDIFMPGRLIEIGGLSFCLGGVVANTGLAMKKLGNKVFLNGLVGNDFIGKTIVENMEKYVFQKESKRQKRRELPLASLLPHPVPTVFSGNRQAAA